MLTGEEAIRLAQSISEGLGPMGRMARKLPSTEGRLEADYLTAAEAGSTLLAVFAPSEDLTRAADEILVRHGAHARHKYGKLAVERLV